MYYTIKALMWIMLITFLPVVLAILFIALLVYIAMEILSMLLSPGGDRHA